MDFADFHTWIQPIAEPPGSGDVSRVEEEAAGAVGQRRWAPDPAIRRLKQAQLSNIDACCPGEPAKSVTVQVVEREPGLALPGEVYVVQRSQMFDTHSIPRRHTTQPTPQRFGVEGTGGDRQLPWVHVCVSGCLFGDVLQMPQADAFAGIVDRKLGGLVQEAGDLSEQASTGGQKQLDHAAFSQV